MRQNPPLALIASESEWLARSLESVLAASGYAVLRAFTPRQALDHARLAQPDAIFIDAGSHTADGGADLCSSLHSDPNLSPNAPIMLLTAGPISRQARLAALRAGAWEVFGIPFDAEALLPQLDTFVRAKLEADQLRGAGLIDQSTGLYNMQGLLRRVRELGAAARRHHQALTCIVFGPAEERETMDSEMMAELMRVFRDECRAGDVLGRLGPKEFVILAPNTGPAGAVLLARRITAAADAGHPLPELLERTRLRAGLFAVPDFGVAAIQPVEMLVRATLALRRSRAELTGERIVHFDPSARVPAG